VESDLDECARLVDAPDYELRPEVAVGLSRRTIWIGDRVERAYPAGDDGHRAPVDLRKKPLERFAHEWGLYPKRRSHTTFQNTNNEVSSNEVTREWLRTQGGLTEYGLHRDGVNAPPFARACT